MAATLSLTADRVGWRLADEVHPTLLRSTSRLARDEQFDCDANYSILPELSLPGMTDHLYSELLCQATSLSLEEEVSETLPRSRSKASDDSADHKSMHDVPGFDSDGLAKLCRQLLSGSISGGIHNPYNVSALKSFLTSPVPESLGMVQCRVLRDGNGLNAVFPKYVLELDSAVLVLTAQKQMHSKACNYAILLPEAVCPGASEPERSLGKLNPDFCGLQFIGYGEGLSPKKMKPSTSSESAREEVIAVQYNSSVWGQLAPGVRHMTVTIPRVTDDGERRVCRPVRPQSEGLTALKDASCLVDVFQSKEPGTDPDGTVGLDFRGRVTEASIKNFQLVRSQDDEQPYVQFGRVGRGAFHLDLRFPFSPVQAFAACLSTFNTKLCCE
mmetsp:Transcript_1456/g.4301  ORF Transcript_1456/g.4301 Transcript_1456/m.4301 type:complete len:385 (-) Transcript_1456:127-1281(-)